MDFVSMLSEKTHVFFFKLYNLVNFLFILRWLVTDLVVHLWHLQLDFVALQQVVFALFSDRRNQVELTGDRVRFLSQPHTPSMLAQELIRSRKSI